MLRNYRAYFLNYLLERGSLLNGTVEFLGDGTKDFERQARGECRIQVVPEASINHLTPHHTTPAAPADMTRGRSLGTGVAALTSARASSRTAAYSARLSA